MQLEKNSPAGALKEKAVPASGAQKKPEVRQRPITAQQRRIGRNEMEQRPSHGAEEFKIGAAKASPANNPAKPRNS